MADDLCQTRPHPVVPLRFGQAPHLIALACSPASDGRNHEPLQALGQKLVKLSSVESIFPETVWQVLQDQ